MKKTVFLIGLLLCPLLKVSAQMPTKLSETAATSVQKQIPARDTMRKADSTQAADMAKAAALRDSMTIAKRVKTLEAISVKAPRPLYSMEGEVISYNVAEDETAKGLTALDALQNAPSVEVDIEGNITLRGSDKVEVWLNGHPTRIDGASLKVFLQSLPADAIDHIEVIKNPSAKYMVEEGFHIINIVTSARLRNSQFFAAGLGGGSEPSIRPWASYVVKNDKLTANAHLGYRHSTMRSTSSSTVTLRQTDGLGGYDTAAFISENEEYAKRHDTWTCFLNLDYKIDSANSVNLFHLSTRMPSSSTSSSLIDRTDHLPLTRHYLYQNSQTTATFNASSNTAFQWKHKFGGEGHNLSLSLTHFGFWNNQKTDILRAYAPFAGTLPAEMADFNKRTSHPSADNTFNLSTRYNLPIGNKDELTFNLSARHTKGTSEKTPLFFDTLSQGYCIIDSLRHLLTANGSWNGNLGTSWRHKWEYVTLTLGLKGRAEQTQYSLQSLFPCDTSYAYAYIEPTVDITFRTKSMHYFRLTYALTTYHPSPSSLTLSRTYSEDGYSTGNPNLKAEHTHDINLNWNKFFKTHGSLSLSTYAKVSTDNIGTCTSTTDEEDPFLGRIANYTMPYNVGTSYNIGIESNATYRPTAWLNFRLYANLYRSGYAFDYPKTGLVKNEMTSYSLRLNCWVNIAKRIRVNLSGNYSSPTQSLFLEKQNGYNINIGASADFCKRRVSASLNVSDIFNWNKTQSWNTNPFYLAQSTEKADSRFITASLTLRLGKMELENYATAAQGY